MVRKIGLIFLTMLFCGTLAWSHVYAAHNHSAAATEKQTAQETTATKEKPVCPYAGGDTACKSGKDCPCPHCKTGQGSCACKVEAEGCPCLHCKTVQGRCACKAEGRGCPGMGGDTACKCGKDCSCPHCKPVQGPCACKAEAKGCPRMGGDTACKCGEDCPCPHCKTGQGSCACKAGVKECPCPMRSGKMMAAADTPAKTRQALLHRSTKDTAECRIGLRTAQKTQPLG